MSQDFAYHGKKAKKTRYRLHQRQAGKCFYCQNPIGIMMMQAGGPVLEHYIPQSAGGRRVVLACGWCDKTKGMLPGPEFEQIVAEFGLIGKTGHERDVTQQAMRRECKAKNRIIQAAHPPSILGQAMSAARYQRTQAVVVQPEPHPFPMACEEP